MSEIKPHLSSLQPTQENVIALGLALYAQRPVRIISQALAEEFGGKIGDPISLDALLSRPGGWSSCFEDAFRALTAISASAACTTAQKERDALIEVLADIAKVSEDRIQDGIQMGATVWRIALTDIAGEIRTFLARYEAGK